MKKTIVITLWICGFAIPSLAQVNGSTRINLSSPSPSLSNIYRFKSFIGKGEQINLSSSVRSQLYYSQSGNVAQVQERPSTIKIEEMALQEKMPCKIPEGLYQMKIYQPDSTVVYTMRVIKVSDH